MDVKVGQVWESKYGATYKVLYIRCRTIVVEKEDLSVDVIFKRYLEDCKLIVEAQSSDLEIVQKALNKTGRTLRLMPNDRYELIHNESLDLYGRGLASLLTWAKQTIGVE